MIWIGAEDLKRSFDRLTQEKSTIRRRMDEPGPELENTEAFFTELADVELASVA